MKYRWWIIGGIAFFLLMLISTWNPDVPVQEVQPVITESPAVTVLPTTRVLATPTPMEAAHDDSLFLVTFVVDGDTIEIEGGERVRYIGIDTPETVDPREPVQCFGVEAKTRNRDLVLNKRVRLVKDVSDRDRYGRLLRYVYVGDTFVNYELVRRGYAYASTYPPDVSRADEFAAAQSAARAENAGLWGSCPTGTVAPAVTSPPPSGGYSVPPCASSDCNCSDFDSRAHAQWFFDTHDPNNTHGLDGSDNDGLACESLD